MRIRRILTNLLTRSQTKIHGAQTNFLAVAIDAVLRGANLTCANLGRNLSTQTSEKHNIKRVNNMLGNRNLQSNCLPISQAVAQFFLSSRQTPLIAIDWSSTNSTLKFHILRATLIIRDKGRGITIYEEVHPQKKLGNETVQSEFLANLKSIIPNHCRPIIITDAGFYCGWFEDVINQGWDYVGRVRGNRLYRISEKSRWSSIKELFKEASNKAKHLGEIMLTKKSEWKCNAILFKKTSKQRKKKNLTGSIQKATAGRKIAKREREPWLLVTSLDKHNYSANQITAIYSKRMQIEENFRDSKNHACGMGLKEHRSKSAGRIAVLLLIGMLTHFIAYAIGLAAKKIGMHKKFQANTTVKYQVLSFVFLGTQIWKRQFIGSKNDIDKLKIDDAILAMATSGDIIL